MKITDIKYYRVPPRWIFIRVDTDEGLEGWGEPTLEGKDEWILGGMKEIRDYLLGKDPLRIEDHFQVLRRGGFYRGGPVLTSALSGVEQALWDIKGKLLGIPVYELMGGSVRDRMQVYAWIDGDTPAQLAREAAKRIEQGYQAVKILGGGPVQWIDTPARIKMIVQRLAVLRKELGDELQVAVDFHGRVHKAQAGRLLKELEPYMPMFVEEPLTPEHNHLLRQIARATTVPLAAGERLFTRWDFREIIEDGWIDVIQPDISHAGGIWELRKIAAFAEVYDVVVAPHCPLGPIALASALQFDWCTPNVLIQETSLGIHYHRDGIQFLDYVMNPEEFNIEDGHILRNALPGLGVEINRKFVEEQAKKGHDWKNHLWRNPDGSFTEW